MPSFQSQRRSLDLRTIPLDLPPARARLLPALSMIAGAALSALLLYAGALWLGATQVVGYERAWRGLDAFSLTFVTPIHLRKGDALVADYRVDIGKGGVDLRLVSRGARILAPGRTIERLREVESGTGWVRLVAPEDGWYRPAVSPAPIGRADRACADNFRTRSLLQNWFTPDPACAVYDVGYEVTWRVVPGGV